MRFFIYALIGMHFLFFAFHARLIVVSGPKHLEKKPSLERVPLQVPIAKPLHPHYAVSVMACGRLASLNLSLFYLHAASAHFAETTGQLIPVYVSLDCPPSHQQEKDDAMMSLLRAWNSTASLCLFAEWFEQAHDPKNPEFADERVARHWISTLAQLFRRRGYAYVTHLEDDHVVAPTFFSDLVGLTTSWPNAACFNLGCSGDCWGSATVNPSDVTWMEAGNMGVTYSRAFWDLLWENSRRFCSMRGNWDINVHVLQSENKLPLPCATYAMTRVTHMLNAGSARMSSFTSFASVQAVVLPAWPPHPPPHLVDVGKARYALESHEQGPPLPETLQQQCLSLLW